MKSRQLRREERAILRDIVKLINEARQTNKAIELAKFIYDEILSTEWAPSDLVFIKVAQLLEKQ